MNLTDIGVIREVMERHGITFQKKFGQNFLTNAAIVKRIAASAVENLQGEGQILEIGPGIGCLTHELCQVANRVVSVEIDKGLIPILQETLADCPNFRLISGDIMKVDISKLAKDEFMDAPFSVCANLPYNITTPILMRLLESDLPIQSITIMIQKEVADRFCAAPGSKAYGAVTAILNYYGSAEKLFHVTAGNFTPIPKVDSTVIRINMYDTPCVFTSDRDKLFAVVRAAFEQRRKTLRNAIGSVFPGLTKDEIGTVLLSCGFSADVRGESLSIKDFSKITEALLSSLNK